MVSWELPETRDIIVYIGTFFFQTTRAFAGTGCSFRNMNVKFVDATYSCNAYPKYYAKHS